MDDLLDMFDKLKDAARAVVDGAQRPLGVTLMVVDLAAFDTLRDLVAEIDKADPPTK